jgi:methylenetetrahydrofolate dehydrogenase (NADP+)/methenyltetrahydrofolate cyclohydrolase
MNAKIVDGKAYAQGLRLQLKSLTTDLFREHQVVPGLAVVLVGEDPASQVYVRNKATQTTQIGMRSFEHHLPADTSMGELLALIETLNADRLVDGILVQLPLPSHINTDRVLATIDPAKDVDGFHIENVGRLAAGLPGVIPCTPLGCLMLLRQHHHSLSGLNAVVIGRSNIVGKPMAQLLLQSNCTVTIAHSRSRELADICRGADILVAAVGKPEIVKAEWIKPGATVIDVGINRLTGVDGKTRLVGDVDFRSASAVAGAITPVPGGVGPMTIACLLVNALANCHRRHGFPVPDILTLN